MRNNTIDIAKGLGIILVVFGHNALVLQDKGELFRIIFSFHIPLFLFLSGIFLKSEQSFSRLLSSKADALLKPYFAVVGCLGLIKIAVDHESIISYIHDMFYATGSTVVWPPLWFLPYLFIVFVVTWLSVNLLARQRGVNYRQGLVLVCVLFLIGFILLKFQATLINGVAGGGFGNNRIPELPWSIDLVFIGAAYFAMGHVVASFVINFKPNVIWSLITAITFCLLHFFFDETIDLNLRLYGNFLICTLQAFSAIYLVLTLSNLLISYSALKRLFSYLGNGSLFILIFHWPFQLKSFGFLQSHFPHDSIVINGALSFYTGLFFRC